MALGLSNYARRLLSDDAGTRAAQTVPLLVWESPLRSTGEPLLLGTSTGAPMARPRATEPLVFELRKGPSKQNAFSMGITVGRTENNDVILDENSISRFHAYFQQDARTQDWMLVDAESKNGTWVGALKLVPKQAALVTDQSRVRFGEIEMVFLTPPSFFSYLQRLMGG
jgi:pSer/pThr/pTyr-binding forkhead associated (FHA) protein